MQSAGRANPTTWETPLNSRTTAVSIHDIRFANYRTLMRQFEEAGANEGLPSRGSLNRFGDFVGISARYLSHINNRRKNIGDATCRAIETAFKLPTSWMDTDHSRGTDPANEPEAEFTRFALQLYRESPTEAQALMMRYMADKLLRSKPKPM